MKSRLRWFLWVVVSLAAASLLIYALWPQPIAVEWLEAKRGPMQVTVDEDGKTRVKERYVVAAPLAGQLSRIELREGDAVIASQTELATIEPADPALLDARSIAEAEARVRVTQAAMEQATARLAAADELHKLATRHWERAVPLAKSSAIPAEELDEKEHQKAITGENLRAARFAKQVAEFEVQQAEAALLRSKPATSPEKGAQRFVIRSPVDGNVLRVIQKSATIIQPGSQLVEVGDARDLEVVVDVLSADAARIRPGAKAILEHWGGDKPLEGRVRVVEPSGFTKVSALGVEEQRVNVVIDLIDSPTSRATLGDAFRVEAKIVIWEHANALQVPVGALFRDGQHWAVFVVENHRAALRHIDVGYNNGLSAEIRAGLEPGEQVIMHPSDKIRVGSYLRLRRT